MLTILGLDRVKEPRYAPFLFSDKKKGVVILARVLF